jgi:3-hydroxyisobutyrate dehydrogenase-like beta-hydroxyacid dehydrogenase
MSTTALNGSSPQSERLHRRFPTDMLEAPVSGGRAEMETYEMIVAGPPGHCRLAVDHGGGRRAIG